MMPKEFDAGAFAAIPDPHVPEPGEKPLSQAEMAALPLAARQRLAYLERRYKELQASHDHQSTRLRKANWANWSR
jgi:hypothetical protein